MLRASALLVLTAMAPAPAQWQVASGEISVRCPLTVGGGFDAVTTQVTGSLADAASQPPSFGGEIAVDLKTLDTGINLRNTHLREKYLEVGKGEGYERAVLSELKLTGVSGDPAAFQGKTAFTGKLQLHGTSKEVAGEARIQRSGSNIHVDARFPVRLSDYGIEDPRYLGVGVKPVVEVRVVLVVKS